MTHPALTTTKDPDIYQLLSHNLYHFSIALDKLYPDNSFTESERVRFEESVRLHTLIFKHENSKSLVFYCNDPERFFDLLLSILRDLSEKKYTTEEAVKVIRDNVSHHFRLDMETRSSVPELIRWIAFDLVRRFHKEETTVSDEQ